MKNILPAFLVLALSHAAQAYDFESGSGSLEDLSFSDGGSFSLQTSANGSTGLSLGSHQTDAFTSYGLSDPSVCDIFSVGSTLSMSFDLLYTTSANTNVLNWGFADLATGTSISGFSAGYSGSSFEFGVSAGPASSGSGASVTSSTTGSSLFVPDGSYLVDFSVTSLGSDQFQVSSVVSDFTTGATVQGYSDTLTIAGLEGTNVHPMVGMLSGRNTGGQSMVVDNFEVVPEPSSAVLSLLGAALFAGRRRR